MGFSDSSVGKESACNAGDPGSTPGWRRSTGARDRLPTSVFLGFPCGSAGKESPCSVEDLGLIPGLGRSPGEAKGYSLQYSGLENSMNCIVHGVAKSQTRLKRLSTQGPSVLSTANIACACFWASLVAQLVKNLPAMRETWVQSLSWEDPLKKGKTTHSSILAWRIPWTI